MGEIWAEGEESRVRWHTRLPGLTWGQKDVTAVWAHEDTRQAALDLITGPSKFAHNFPSPCEWLGNDCGNVKVGDST